MINLEKINRKSVSPPTAPLRGPAPAPYFYPFFLFFRFPPPSGGGNQNLLSPSLKKRGDLNYGYPWLLRSDLLIVV